LQKERLIYLKSKEQLQKAVDAKDKLFSIVAHDLKNPFLPLLRLFRNVGLPNKKI
jgi:hypothetical protein